MIELRLQPFKITRPKRDSRMIARNLLLDLLDRRNERRPIRHNRRKLTRRIQFDTFRLLVHGLPLPPQ